MLAPYLHKNLLEAGLDEAGRGCYAGPVFAAAVILPKDFHHPLLNDSKQLNEKQRDLLRPVIEKESIAYAVALVDNETIDKINILQAVFVKIANANATAIVNVGKIHYVYRIVLLNAVIKVYSGVRRCYPVEQVFLTTGTKN